MNAGQDSIITHCRFCGETVRMIWTGQVIRGSTWRASFRIVEDHADGQHPHSCPKRWRVFSTRPPEMPARLMSRTGTRFESNGTEAEV
jgi:hypothetical protein